MTIILSPNIDHHSNRNNWLQQLKPIGQSFQRVQEINQVVLPVTRLGFPGLIPDNPPIDDVDLFLSELSDSSFEVGLISIPISASDLINEEAIEVSNINGWIDTAGYANCPHIRFHAINGGLFTDDSHRMFLEIVSYALDLDMKVSLLDFTDAFLQLIQSKCSPEHQHLIGKESSCSITSNEDAGLYLNDGITNLLSIQFDPSHSTDSLVNKLINCGLPIVLNT